MEALAHDQLDQLADEHWWLLGRKRVCLGLLEAALDGRQPARVLDVGSGSGGFLASLRRIGGTLHHVDTDRGSLERCRARGQDGGLQASGGHLPFASETFDLVCLFDVLEHIADDREALTEVARVLRPGGTVFLHVPAHPWLFAQNDRVSGHHRRYTRAALRDLTRAAGLELERLTGTNVLLLPAIAAVILALKGLERLGFGRRSPHTNLSWPLPVWAHSLLARTFAAELLLSRTRDLPTGHSLALVARKAA